MNDQRNLWENAHKTGTVEHYSRPISEFASEVLTKIQPNSEILELGCGVGKDAVAFAKAGHSVVATDFSRTAIQKNSQKFAKIPNLVFRELDISQAFPFEDNNFDVIYARLSLHYFTHDVTLRIFSEISRVLKSGGSLYFMCKSIDDPQYGMGEKIEDKMYIDHGHVRHFFSDEYVKQCLKNVFNIQNMETGSGIPFDKEWAYVKVNAVVEK